MAKVDSTTGDVLQKHAFGRLLYKLFGQDLTDVNVLKAIFAYEDTVKKTMPGFTFIVRKMPNTEALLTVTVFPDKTVFTDLPSKSEESVTIELTGDARYVQVYVYDTRYGKTEITIHPHINPIRLKLTGERPYLTALLDLLFDLLIDVQLSTISVNVQQILAYTRLTQAFVDANILTQKTKGRIVPMPYALCVIARSMSTTTTDLATNDNSEMSMGELFTHKVTISLIDIYQAGLTLTDISSKESQIEMRRQLLAYLNTSALGDHALLRLASVFLYRSELYALWF